ncbi:MAG: hypothetical protein HY671_00080 [Chloroflexi bacterium]|nr:hypothetical protein [Chloroflexota bacterium]
MDKVRENDLPPEFCQYRDEGCEVEPSCLICSLPQCVYDTPHRLRRLKHRRRDEAVRRASRSGVPVASLVLRFRISRRTVYRIISDDPAQVRNRK